MQQAGIAIPEVDKLRVWTLTDNYYDALRPDSKITRRCRVVPGKSIHAEHGLAYFVETHVNRETNACMFDFGLDADGVMKNMEILDLDLGKTSAFALSHGHFDHWGGAVEILKQNRARIAKNAPFYTGEEAFLRRYTLRPGTKEIVDIGQLEKKDIETLGLRVMEIKNPMQIIPGAWCTGNIERVTEYEKALPNLLVERNGQCETDDFKGEQALCFKVKSKGLVVLSGCGHAGIVNTVKHAQKITGINEVHAILGGFHLINAKPEVIRNTVDAIHAMKPDYIAPTHCTGFEALVAFNNRMPDEFILNTAGTQYTFSG
jgi:7,8-dihydropterin-6-yl-methyl-4-(beta-D-ribofuranosyl)aminobenzene 5'-phosphate synthase